jgi:hypothetical protein
MSTPWQSPHRLYPFTSKDCAESVEQTRAEWVEVLPDPPSEVSWRWSDGVVSAIGVGACAWLVFGGVPV